MVGALVDELGVFHAAARLGLARNTVYRILGGNRAVFPSTLVRIRERLGGRQP
jgi:hypothetical protein